MRAVRLTGDALATFHALAEGLVRHGDRADLISLEIAVDGTRESMTAARAVQVAVPLLDLALDQTTGDHDGAHLAIVRPDGTIERIHLT